MSPKIPILQSPKPLMWEKVKFTARFDFVDMNKVVHVVADEGITKDWKENEWSAEYGQTTIGVNRVREWVSKVGDINDDDIFISGDVDEVMSQEALRQLKWCKTAAPVISGALWVPMGNLLKAFRSPFHVEGRNHTFAMPSIYSWGSVRSGMFSGGRLINHDFRGKYVSGGIHLTSNAFLATALLKEITATEDDFYNGNVNLQHLLNMDMEDMKMEQNRLYVQYYRPMWKELLDPVEIVDDVEFYLPWFLDCNRDRFPYWFGRPDPRNKILLDGIKQLKVYLKIPENKNKDTKHLFSRIYMKDQINKALFISKPLE